MSEVGDVGRELFVVSMAVALFSNRLLDDCRTISLECVVSVAMLLSRIATQSSWASTENRDG